MRNAVLMDDFFFFFLNEIICQNQRAELTRQFLKMQFMLTHCLYGLLLTFQEQAIGLFLR